MKKLFYVLGIVLVSMSLLFSTPSYSQNDNAARTEQTTDDDDDDTGNWGLAGLLGLLGLLGLKRRDDDGDKRRGPRATASNT